MSATNADRERLVVIAEDWECQDIGCACPPCETLKADASALRAVLTDSERLESIESPKWSERECSTCNATTRHRGTVCAECYANDNPLVNEEKLLGAILRLKAPGNGVAVDVALQFAHFVFCDRHALEQKLAWNDMDARWISDKEAAALTPAPRKDGGE